MARTTYVLDSKTMPKKANEVVSVLKDHSGKNPCLGAVLAGKVGLTKPQLARVIKYMRNCSLADLDNFIAYYPISTKKGYFLPERWSDFAPCYVTLEAWISSLSKSIAPMRKKMTQEGIDWKEEVEAKRQEKKDYDNWLDDIPEMNKDTSWFLDD